MISPTEEDEYTKHAHQTQEEKVPKGKQKQQGEEVLKAQTKHFESIITQLAQSLGGQLETTNAQIQQLT
ncbi:hypothetical protein A2U01_0057090, partial [Trifolium medium]|nr:hypothetical protein [Trifolium medium]